MSWSRRRKVQKSQIVLSVVNSHTVHAKTTKMPDSDLNVIKKACHVNDRRKSFELSRVDVRTLMTFSDKYTIDPLPPHVIKVLQRKSTSMFDEKKIPPKLWETLFPYQKEGVRMIFDKYDGRCLLADDMGLGKTYQGLAFMGHCAPNKMLIVCPSYLRYHWQHEIKNHLGLASQLVKKGNEPLEQDVCIVSYDMLHKLDIATGVFDVVLADESHYAKSRKTKRTKALTPLVKSARFSLLITGTPALNRPIELFPQLFMLRPAYIKNYTTYAARYCNGKATPFGYDDRGSSNSCELNWILNKAFMVRRLKRDVLTQLPPKTRHTIWLEVKTSELTEVKSGFSKWKSLNETIYKCATGSEQQRQQMFERQQTISILFNATAVAKCNSVVTWVSNALDEGRSFIFFAYHKCVLDAVEEAVLTKGISYMRIDGSTPAHKRQAYVDNFQSDANIRIAILSIMAAGTGVTLTRVTECVMGELFWVPGVMIQAEDRIHRISQTGSCEIKYLLGTETLDTYIFPTLCKKLRTLDNLVDKRADRTFKGKTSTVYLEEDENLLDILKKMF
jgi:SWI/SNF-related matrix-associated actin-dependent regulator 1 of chromatin subfamily A